MGKVMSLMMRPVKKFNIENRAHKVISRDKPVQAPHYESTKKQIEIANTINPNFMETHNKKDPELNERLKNVFVASSDVKNPEIEPDPERPLPILTRTGPGFEYGFWEPEEIPGGKCTLKSAVTFMSDHVEDPVKNSVSAISLQYKLDPKHVANILEYYRVFKVVVAEDHNAVSRVEQKHVPPSPRRIP